MNAAASLHALVARQRRGWTLDAEFYCDPDVHAADLARIWRQGWLFVAHSCDLPEPGSYLTLDITGEPVVLVRGRDDRVRGFYNVCRHRGAKVCTAATGRAQTLVCPYHQWSYALDGRLLRDIAEEHGADPSALGLKPIAVEEVEGLVFASLARQPVDFAPARAQLGPGLAPHDLARTKVAAQVDYVVEADWKVVFENNRECYHCAGAHPEYIRANYDLDVTNGTRRDLVEATLESCAVRWREMGLALPTAVSDMTGTWFRCNRTPLVEGFLTESLDGRLVAPLLGNLASPDVGTLRITTFPNFWTHVSCDHAMTTRLLPLAAGRTAVRVSWLVRGDAVEGRDYDVAEITPFWQRTSEQDWVLCESVQAGLAIERLRAAARCREPASATCRVSSTGTWASWTHPADPDRAERGRGAPDRAGGPGSGVRPPEGGGRRACDSAADRAARAAAARTRSASSSAPTICRSSRGSAPTTGASLDRLAAHEGLPIGRRDGGCSSTGRTRRRCCRSSCSPICVGGWPGPRRAWACGRA